MLVVNLNYNFEFDWFVELSDDNLASELVGNRSFFKPITFEEIVIFMIIQEIVIYPLYNAIQPLNNWGPKTTLTRTSLPGYGNRWHDYNQNMW